MAFFNLRVPGQSNSSASSETLQTTPAESLEVLRKRARHRLMGSVVLVLAAVIGFPLLFDTQPRPVSVDTPIVIPDRNAVPSMAPATPAAAPVTAVAGVVSPPPAAAGASATATATATASVSASASATGPLPPAGVLDANEEVVSATPRPAEKAARTEEPKVAAGKAGDFKVDFGKTAAAVSSAPAPAPAAKLAQAKPETKAESKTAAPEKAHDKSHDDAAKARALLDGKEPAASAKSGDERLVIQVGAYTDAAKVREARQKLEAAGFKTYTQVIDSKDGKRTRVRVGPFESKAEADKSAQKIRKLQLDTAILKL